MRKTATITAMAAALAVTTLAPAMADGTTATITGTVGQRVDDTGSYIKLRHVGETAPDGYDDGYQHAGPYILTASPEEGLVTMEGTLDLSGMVPGVGGIVGLYDAETLRTGGEAHKHDNGIYVHRSSSGYNIGVSDGNASGEIVQNFTSFPAELAQPIAVRLEFDGTADPAGCSSHSADDATADGCMTLWVNGVQAATDSYGTLTDQAVELSTGANPGWWAFGFPETGDDVGAGIDYDLTISPTVMTAPATVDDCKDGGHEAFDFKNQGLCVASVQANDNAGK